MAKLHLRWILFNTILWGLGFTTGLAAGFLLPVIGDVIAVLITGGLLIWYQSREVQNFVGLLSTWKKMTTVGLLAGVAAGFFETLVFNNALGMSEAHVVAFPLTLLIIAISQAIALRETVVGAWIWILMNISAGLVGLLIAILVETTLNIDFRLDLLDVRQRDVSAILPWGVLGSILGCVYSIFTLTGFFLMKSRET